ncbi:probable UDP-arabinopyranose mutase 5 [Lactuca sativa]|uniref:probable UDP-arabinopyranose mutase 5 n=1 Tax=Lactuca sativa TaxID=4236 RepID=UPI000CD964B2|nr:probable UDP-arabinopyranose mutase 5 [Lactuca sativa]
MSQVTIDTNEIDIVIAAFHSDLTSFLESWRPIFSRFHLIIIQDPDLKQDLKIPKGFDINIYTKSDIDKLITPSNSAIFSGYSSRYFGYLISKRKYIVSIDDDCVPAKDNNDELVDIVTQHIVNLKTPATPFFFNTLYDPYRNGSDFVRGYPFSLRSGVPCVLSCGLWLNLADYDAPTQALKPESRNLRYVDAVMTVPRKAMMPMSGINIAFDREILGPALLPGLKLAKEGKFRWETMEDVWCGLVVKAVCDHLRLGVKSGVPYVWRNERGSAIDSLKKEWEGVKLMEELVPFFQTVEFSEGCVTAEGCVMEMAAAIEKELGGKHPEVANAAEKMVEWVKLWKEVESGVLG